MVNPSPFLSFITCRGGHSASPFLRHRAATCQTNDKRTRKTDKNTQKKKSGTVGFLASIIRRPVLPATQQLGVIGWGRATGYKETVNRTRKSMFASIRSTPPLGQKSSSAFLPTGSRKNTDKSNGLLHPRLPASLSSQRIPSSRNRI